LDIGQPIPFFPFLHRSLKNWKSLYFSLSLSRSLKQSATLEWEVKGFSPRKSDHVANVNRPRTEPKSPFNTPDCERRANEELRIRIAEISAENEALHKNLDAAIKVIFHITNFQNKPW
jgi:hypothetical protein